ncbi:uncharacterized protein BDV17DRAFT_100824 [Aspergillus undulatus]|uniref:uncharacterized protein n=1 Tax=Aspergillus undulatus TaxID=1810928 RepID=UPI003CCD9D26
MRSIYSRRLRVNGFTVGLNCPLFCTANFAKEQLDYKTRFQGTFWSVIDKDLNGTFHCQYDHTNKRVTPKISWSCYKLKRAYSANNYNWKQLSLHITWNAQTETGRGRQVAYIFDFLPFAEQMDFLQALPSPEARRHNPFSWHAVFARVVLEQYDEALWMIRDLVKAHEKVGVFAYICNDLDFRLSEDT